MEASIKDLRLHARELIAATDRGEEVVITWHGKRRARLVPLVESGSAGRASGGDPGNVAAAQERNPAFGLWRDRTGNVDDELRQLRRRRDLP